MSRGLGRSQRRLLDEIDRNGSTWLADLAPAGSSEYQSLYRAAMRLNDIGRIAVIVFYYGKEKVLLAPVGTKTGRIVMEIPIVGRREINGLERPERRSPINGLSSTLRRASA